MSTTRSADRQAEIPSWKIDLHTGDRERSGVVTLMLKRGCHSRVDTLSPILIPSKKVFVSVEIYIWMFVLAVSWRWLRVLDGSMADQWDSTLSNTSSNLPYSFGQIDFYREEGREATVHMHLHTTSWGADLCLGDPGNPVTCCTEEYLEVELRSHQDQVKDWATQNIIRCSPKKIITRALGNEGKILSGEGTIVHFATRHTILIVFITMSCRLLIYHFSHAKPWIHN